MSTPNLAIVHIAASQNQKEVTANTAFNNLDTALTNPISIAMADADRTLTGAEALQNLFFTATGTMTADRNLIVPTNKKLYIVKNQTTGGHNVTVKTSAGTGVKLEPFSIRPSWLYCDGTNVITIAFYDTPVVFRNNADAAQDLILDSGKTAAQNCSISFRDRGVGKVSLIKDGANGFTFNIDGVGTVLATDAGSASARFLTNARFARLRMNQGGAIVAGDLTFTGWGTGATAAIFANSRDACGRISITAGTTPSANPTLRLTFRDGTWDGTVPTAVYQRGDANATAGRWALTTLSALFLEWTFVGTPVDTEVYAIDYSVHGLN